MNQYKLIAETIRNAKIDQRNREIMANEFALSLVKASVNHFPLFNPSIFIQDCGVNDGKN